MAKEVDAAVCEGYDLYPDAPGVQQTTARSVKFPVDEIVCGLGQELTSEQKWLTSKLARALVEVGWAMCVAQMGAGKTAVMAAAAQMLDLDVVYVGPPSVLTQTVAPTLSAYGVELLHAMSYESLSCMSQADTALYGGGDPGGQRADDEYVCSHGVTAKGLLYRTDYRRTSDKDKRRHVRQVFTPTTYGNMLFAPAQDGSSKRGVMLVLDECQFIKNNGTIRYDAMVELVRLLYTNPASCVLYMSYTPFDSVEQIQTFCRINQIIRPGLNFMPRSKRGECGLLQAATYFDWLATKMTRVEEEAPLLPTAPRKKIKIDVENTKQAHDVLLERFCQSARNTVLFGITRPHNPELNHQYFCRYMPIRVAEQHTALVEQYESLVHAVEQFETATSLAEQDLWLQTIGAAHKSMEYIKLTGAVIADALQQLQADPMCKVQIGISYVTDHVPILLKELAAYNPVVVCSATSGLRDAGVNLSVRQRQRDIALFNENNSKCRVMIMGIRAGGVGISTHDQYGQYRRIMYMLPCRHYMAMVQFTGRSERFGTRSSVTLYCVLANGANNELDLLRRIQARADVQQRVVDSTIGLTSCRIDDWPKLWS